MFQTKSDLSLDAMIVISHSGSETSLAIIVHRLAFLLKLNLIIHHYFTYINAFTLVHLSVFEFASIYLCVLTCVNKN